MVDTSTSTNDNTKEISTSSHSSGHYENEIEKNDELQRAIASGKKLMRVFEEQNKLNLQERDLKRFLETKYEKIIPIRDIAIVVDSLIHVLNHSVRQNQQLRLKNMILKSNNGDVQSRYEVEDNLKKQQFERMKCQLFLERENLLKKLEIKDGKVIKYKNKIIGKNREINRLMRILNEHSISDTGRTNPANNNNDNSDNHNNNNLTRPRPVTNSLVATSKASGMLKTLGVLASQVLNDEAVDEDTANQTTIQANNSNNSKGPIECNTTEPEILHSPNVTVSIPNAESLSEQSSDPMSKIETGNHENFLKSLPTQLPKMKRFSTVDGTVKDIE